MAMVLIGIVLAVAGFYVSKTVKLPFLEKLAEQGIPLDPGKTVSTIGVFIALFPILNFFYFKPLGEAIGQRTTDLERIFAEAESLRSEIAQVRTDYERRLAEKEAEAREQIQAQIREAQQLRQNLMAEASERADELVKRANQEIELEKIRVLAELRNEVVNMTLAATEKLIGSTMDEERSRRLVNEFIDKVGASA